MWVSSLQSLRGEKFSLSDFVSNSVDTAAAAVEVVDVEDSGFMFSHLKTVLVICLSVSCRSKEYRHVVRLSPLGS